MHLQVIFLEDRSVPSATSMLSTFPNSDLMANTTSVGTTLNYEEIARPQLGADFQGPVPERSFRAVTWNEAVRGAMTRSNFDEDSTVLPQTAFENLKQGIRHLRDLQSSPLPIAPTTASPVINTLIGLRLIPEARKVVFSKIESSGDSDVYRVAEFYGNDVSRYNELLSQRGQNMTEAELDAFIQPYYDSDIVDLSSGTAVVIRNPLLFTAVPVSGVPVPSDLPLPWLIFEKLPIVDQPGESLYRVVRSVDNWCGTGLALNHRWYLSRSTTIVNQAGFDSIVNNGETTCIFDLSNDGYRSMSVEDYLAGNA